MSPTITARQGDITAVEVDAIVVNLFAGVTRPGGATGAVDQALGGAITALIAGGDFKGKLGDVAVLYPGAALPAHRVLIAGLGPRDGFSFEQVRRAAAAAAEKAGALGARSVATIVHGAGIANLEPRAAARAVAEGSVLGAYTFDTFKSTPTDTPIADVTIVEFDGGKMDAVAAGASEGMTIAECANFARDLVNEPPNSCTPTSLAARAEQVAAAYGGHARVVEMPEMRELNMGALLSVAAGSAEPAKLIVLEHDPGQAEAAPLVFVGKAITFDTGGYSLKSYQNMAEMKTDMAGGAAVLGALRAAMALGAPQRVIGIIPATENMVSGRASRPSDVVTASNGKTIEIISTDAEGRMVLADALVYAARYEPAAVIDLATLTGAAMTALGRGGAAALFTNDDALRDRILRASADSGERVWPMPLFDEYAEWMRRSEVADLRNAPSDRHAGTGSSAA
ncbi:MAG: M17 family metallopeptidase, partial [Anaerolineales bacterium]